MIRRQSSGKSQRGVALIWLITLLAAAGSVFTLSDTADELAQKVNDRNRRDKIQMDNSADAISDYALNRADVDMFLTSQPGQRNIPPRLLTLPCPDNANDIGGLDGIEDASCGAPPPSGINRTNGILHEGSRFGMLPQAQTLTASKAALGLGSRFAEGSGNNYWYAIARNVAPRITYHATVLASLASVNIAVRPLNLHHLANEKTPGNWLEVVKVSPVSPGIESVATLSNIAAVIIAPGANRAAKLPATTQLTLDTNSRQDAATSPFLDSVVIATATGGGNTIMLENNDRDGIFVDAAPRQNFDDRIAYLSAEEWWREDGEFVRRYKNKTGITDIHNRPAPDSPLEKIQKIIVAYHNLVGSYPTPSKNATTNINNIRRHPAAFNAGPTEITLIKITPPSLTVTTASLAIITIITAMVTTTPPPPPITTMAKYTIMSEYLITTTTGITSYVKNVALITWNIGSELKLIAAQPITAHIFDIIAIPINTITTTITLPPPPAAPTLITTMTRTINSPNPSIKLTSASITYDDIPTLRIPMTTTINAVTISIVNPVTISNITISNITVGNNIISILTRTISIATRTIGVITAVSLSPLPATIFMTTGSVTSAVTTGPPSTVIANPVTIGQYFRFTARITSAISVVNTVAVTTSLTSTIATTTVNFPMMTMLITATNNIFLNFSSPVTAISYRETNLTIMVSIPGTSPSVQTTIITAFATEQHTALANTYPQGEIITVTSANGLNVSNPRRASRLFTVMMTMVTIDLTITGTLAISNWTTMTTTMTVTPGPNTSITIQPGGMFPLPGILPLTLPIRSPLTPPTTLYSGWLSEETKGLASYEGGGTAATRYDFFVPIDSTAVFFSPTRITTMSSTITLSTDNIVIIKASSTIHHTFPPTLANIVILPDNITLNNAVPDRESYDKGGFAIFLLEDAPELPLGNSKRIFSPAIVYPWRQSANIDAHPPSFYSLLNPKEGFDATINITLPGKKWHIFGNLSVTASVTLDTEIPVQLQTFSGEFLSITVRQNSDINPVLVDDNLETTIPAANIYESQELAFDAFVEDHPMYYAVSGDCLYGGEISLCTGGITLSIAQGATIALPEPLPLNAAGIIVSNAVIYANNGMQHRITINNGVVAMAPASIIIAADNIATLITQTKLQHIFVAGTINSATNTTIPITANAAAPSRLFINNGSITIEAHLQEGQIIQNAQPLTINTGTPIIARSPSVRIENIAALIAFSPAPLTRAECGNTASSLSLATVTVTSPTPPTMLTLANQTDVDDDKMTDLCAWLDDAENNDGDNNYIIKPANSYNYPQSTSNDYLLIFRGNLNL